MPALNLIRNNVINRVIAQVKLNLERQLAWANLKELILTMPYLLSILPHTHLTLSVHREGLLLMGLVCLPPSQHFLLGFRPQ